MARESRIRGDLFSADEEKARRILVQKIYFYMYMNEKLRKIRFGRIYYIYVLFNECCCIEKW